MRMYRLSFLLTLLVLVAACDSNGNQPNPMLSGTYAFETPPNDSTTGTINLAESEEGGLVGSGTVQFRNPDGTVAVAFPISNIEGSHTHPNVSMQWDIEGQGPYSEVGPWEIDGTANDAGDRISGTLTRDEGNTTQIVLTTP